MIQLDSEERVPHYISTRQIRNQSHCSLGNLTKVSKQDLQTLILLNMKAKLNVNGLDLISDDLLKDLRGGVAETLSKEKENSKEGDGAQYVCGISIEFPSRN